MVLFSIGFWYAYSSTEYSSKAQSGATPRPIMSAVLHALNPSDLISGTVRAVPMSIALHRSGEWKAWRNVAKESGVTGLVRKGIRRYRNRGDKATKINSTTPSSEYQGLHQEMDSVSRPAEMHHGPDTFGASPNDGYSLGGYGGGSYDQPPRESGQYSEEQTSYLMADTTATGRPRSQSGSYLMVDHNAGTATAPSNPAGQWNGQRYDRSPSPDARFETAPTHGRDMV